MMSALPLRRSALLCATILVSSHPLHAQSVRTGVDISTEAEATTNPYLDQDSSDWVGAGSLEVRPWLVSETPTGRIQLEAFVRGRAFTSTYDFEDTLGASVGASHRANPRTSFYGQASVTSSSARSNVGRFNRSGFAPDPLTPTGPAAPGQPLDPGTGLGPVIVPPIDDLTIIGLQDRTTTLSLAAGMARQLDARSSLSTNIGYNRLWVSGDQFSGYDSISLDAAYSRRISARTTGGFSFSAGQSRYENDLPKTTTLGAYLNAQHQISGAWSLSWSLGVSNSRSPALGPIPEVNETGLAGSVSLCRAQAQSRLCLGLSRSQQPSSLGQVRTQDSVNLSYSERLSARDRIDLYGNFARSGAPSAVATPFDEVEIASVGANFTRVLSPRLDGYLFGRASRSYGGYLSDEPNISIGIGIRARLGDPR